MQEKQLKALMDWVESLVRATVCKDGQEWINEMNKQALLRNHFGFHQHDDHSGPRLHPDYDGEPHGTEED